MSRRYAPRDRIGTALAGRRISRRAFLQASALAAMAMPGLSAAARGFVASPPQRSHIAPGQLGRDSIGDLAAALSYDVDAIFAFVRDRVRYEPYVGLLRGPRVTLATRAGNSIDQAALLSALLDASLVPFRYVHGPLDPDDQAALWSSAAADAASVAAAAEPDPLATDEAVSDPAVVAAIEGASVARELVLPWARSELEETVALIEDAVRQAGVELGHGFEALPIREVDQHHWIQVAQGPSWRDLDPTLPDRPTSQVVSTYGQVPDDLRHVVELTVVAEIADSDALRTDTLLRVVSTADRLAGLPITFLNANPAGVASLGAAITPMAGAREYMPTIALGDDEAYAGSPIRFGVEGAFEGGAADLLDAGTLPGSVAAGETTAEWLDLKVISPDRDPVEVRRTIFDRLGETARGKGQADLTALAPVAEVTLGDGSKEVLPVVGTTWLTVSTGLPDQQMPLLSAGPDDVGGSAIYALGQSVMREFGDRALAVPLGVRSFPDAPNVVSMNARAQQHGEAISYVAGMDILHRSRMAVPVDGQSPRLPPSTVAGVLDHVVERITMGDAAATDPPPSASGPVSVGAVFEQARRDGVDAKAVRSASDVDGMGLPLEAAARLRSSLADGFHVAVVPERPVSIGEQARIGWWLIDARTGYAVDELDDGRGNTEYQATLLPSELAQETLARRMGQDCLLLGISTMAVMISVFIADRAGRYDGPALALAAWATMTGGLAGQNVIGPRCIGGSF